MCVTLYSNNVRRQVGMKNNTGQASMKTLSEGRETAAAQSQQKTEEKQTEWPMKEMKAPGMKIM